MIGCIPGIGALGDRGRGAPEIFGDLAHRDSTRCHMDGCCVPEDVGGDIRQSSVGDETLETLTDRADRFPGPLDELVREREFLGLDEGFLQAVVDRHDGPTFETGLSVSLNLRVASSADRARR